MNHPNIFPGPLYRSLLSLCAVLSLLLLAYGTLPANADDFTDVSNRVTKIQTADETLPTVPEQKGAIGTIIAKIFNPASKKIRTVFLDAFGTISTSAVPRWDGSKLVTGQIADNGTNVGIGTTGTPTSKLTVVGSISATNTIISSTGQGYVALSPGNTGNPGFISWMRPDNTTRIGYLGWGTSGPNNLHLQLENAANFYIAGGNVAIGGTAAPTQRLDVTGNARVSGDVMAGRLCKSDGTSCVTLPIAAGNIDGTGNANYVARFTDANTLGIGTISDNGTIVGIGTTSPMANTKLNVIGGTHADLTGGGMIVIGGASGANLALDSNDIMARSNGSATSLNLNANGGLVNIGAGGLMSAGSIVSKSQLSVDDATGSAGFILSPLNSTFNSQLQMYTTDNSGTSTNLWNVIGYGSASATTAIRDDLRFYYTDYTSGTPTVTDTLFLDHTGKVGIGTINPSTDLDVNGATKSTSFRSNSYCDAAGNNCSTAPGATLQKLFYRTGYAPTCPTGYSCANAGDPIPSTVNLSITKSFCALTGFQIFTSSTNSADQGVVLYKNSSDQWYARTVNGDNYLKWFAVICF